jgi:hypothetical protein
VVAEGGLVDEAVDDPADYSLVCRWGGRWGAAVGGRRPCTRGSLRRRRGRAGWGASRCRWYRPTRARSCRRPASRGRPSPTPPRTCTTTCTTSPPPSATNQPTNQVYVNVNMTFKAKESCLFSMYTVHLKKNTMMLLPSSVLDVIWLINGFSITIFPAPESSFHHVFPFLM